MTVGFSDAGNSPRIVYLEAAPYMSDLHVSYEQEDGP